MSQQGNSSFLVELTDKNDPDSISAPFNSFMAFALQISLDLDELELRFEHLCTNSSLQTSLRQSR